MKKYNLKEKYKIKLLDIIQSKLPECKVYLVGSRSTSTNQPGADIDLVLDNKKPIDPKIILSLLSSIEDTDIPLFVDLVDFNSASEDFKKSIERDKVLWKK